MDFYESMFPVPSQFELPPIYRNKYLHLNEFLKYSRMRKMLSSGFYLVLVIMILIVIANIFHLNVAQQLRNVFDTLKQALVLLIPNFLYLKKPHRKLSQSDRETESKYDV